MEESLDSFVNKLNSISNTFCLAKYDQFTVHIHQAIVHSCHLSQTKNIDASMITNAYSFFNFEEIKKLRRDMKEGKQIADCKYCWKIENSSSLNSERHIKSAYLKERFEEIKEMNPLEEDIIPSYLELSFSSVCNFKCSYCNLNFSTTWKKDLVKYGDFNIPGGHNQMSYLFTKNVDDLVEKFWHYFPEILKNLKTLRITGGEPTLQKELYDNILDLIDSDTVGTYKDLELSINSNLGANKKVIDNFVSKLKSIENKVKHINIFTSCDSFGADAEFIREGLNYEYWKSNCYYILNELKDASVNIMCTVNNLCLTENFIKFIKDIYDMTELSIGRKRTRTYFNMEILMVPVFQAVDFLDYELFKDIIKKIEDMLLTMEVKKDENQIITSKGFSIVELKRFSRVRKLMTSNKQNDMTKKELKINFIKYIAEMSRRNNKNYLEIFSDAHYQTYFSDKTTRVDIGGFITMFR